MRVLLDTHALLWWFAGDPHLSRPARDIIGQTDNEILISAATAWEIATKVRIGRLPSAVRLVAAFASLLEEQSFTALPVTLDHALRAGNLPGPHRDPFDRMLIAQAQAEDMPIISNELLFDSYGIRRIW